MSAGGRLGVSPPLPTAAERDALAVRADIDARLEAARVRLEAAELLRAGAPRDALVLCRELLGDLAAVLAALAPKPPGEGEGEANGALSRRCDDLLGRASTLADGDTASRVVDDVRALLRDVVLRYREVSRTSLATRLDAWRRRVRLGVGVAGLVILALAGWSLRPPSPAARLATFDRDFAAGLEALNGGDAAAAARLFGRAVENLPDAPRRADAYNDLGWSLAKLGRYDEAIVAYETAIRRNPGSEIYQNNLDLARRERDAKRK